MWDTYVYVLYSKHPDCLDFYIGQTRDLTARLGAHKRVKESGTRNVTKCGKAILKYGKDSFFIAKLHKCKNEEMARNIEKMLCNKIGYDNLLNCDPSNNADVFSIEDSEKAAISNRKKKYNILVKGETLHVIDAHTKYLSHIPLKEVLDFMRCRVKEGELGDDIVGYLKQNTDTHVECYRKWKKNRD